MKLRIVFVVLMIATPALAQQEPASGMALHINSAVGTLALELDQARQSIATLQKQLADANAKLKEKEPKPAAKPADE